MRAMILLAFLLNIFFLQATAQDSTASSAPTPTSSVSLTPAMSSSAVAAQFSSLATSSPQQPGDGPAAGDAGSSAGAGDSNAGAAGGDSGSITLSRGAIIALITIAGTICIVGIVSSVLWYLAKKRSWEVRAKIRRSARRVATALTPRRSTFPKNVQDRRRASTRGLTKINEVPNTPRDDVEKGMPKMSSFELSEPPKKSKWARLGR
ncbi:hypothetical protein LHYA1_G006119 [Lachnellula hyalina]|uniref:Transmembrane protein n=1 Tax=Lachnellula hyalina TaxID=1316788 RepID=A0A8H8QYS8_9HELO|nr:uncharacterized protein LHYA1_G006119 [Lachnellula hyalina]TVY24961.1 hypothetical protein LHYA1_G006119 [Lachnellula hyalina]